MTFTPAELNGQRLIAIAVPVAAFPNLTQNERTYRQALFADWQLMPFDPAGTAAPTELGIDALPCRGAVASLQGQFSLATQKDPTTQMTYLRSAAVSGNAEAIHLVFLVPVGVEPFTVLHCKQPVYVCTPEANAALINRLFLPKRPISRWQAARIDLHDQPLNIARFGQCVEIRRDTFLTRTNDRQETETLKPAEGKVFYGFHFAPQTAGFDFHRAEWHLVFADSTSVEPFAVSASGGKGYLIGATDATDFRGGATTTPVLLFEGPANGTPLKLQYQTQVVLLPQ